MGDDLGGNARLNIGRLRLDGFIADRGKLPRLIGHAALLAAHAKGAGFTGVLRGEGFGGILQPHPRRRFERVENFLRATADNRLGHPVPPVFLRTRFLTTLYQHYGTLRHKY